MNKGLEINVEVGLCTKEMAKENPIKDFEILIEEYKDKWSKQMYDYFKECLSIIEKELKQAQKDKEVLNVFKNALTIKRTYVLPKERDSSDDTFSYACRCLYEITQNDIDEKLRKSLREWVLENAFPKELKEHERLKEDIKKCSCWKEHKALEIIKNKQVNIHSWHYNDCNKISYEIYKQSIIAKTISSELLTPEEYELLREVLDYGK